MSRLLVFGPGYTASRLMAAARGRAWAVDAVTRAILADPDQVAAMVARATHILSSVPPEGDDDPVLARHGPLLAGCGAWLGYLSSTGVYGDAGGAWVDETADIGTGRRSARARADAAWLALGARVFRLPGIYGPGRSALDRVAAGSAHQVDVPGQIFSRVHVDDIVTGVMAGFAGPPGAYNLADDEPAPQNDVVRHAARLLGLPDPPFVALDALSPMARGFYAENRRVANGKARRALGWTPAFPDYRAGLRALSASTSPISASPPPAIAVGVQR
ncbi:SDR family NAD(P)-dependent oxidoreductase [Sphingomonas changnyeongensis]|uniref:SDR family NAD(P)-dependent oxidoreductase n=1 Tax=Sphingomonas changnyeongensis TaxID=2698679 RepID=A0A7Z2NX99_9SPHN|nr:SDR family NAD(P)-dependent oxidoreductase [Sphingomonas changnyeongensis]QHL91521.1 SDR family NAD(P)-dependent oxidoreductase [Sphingomonas changnyeongensis]